MRDAALVMSVVLAFGSAIAGAVQTNLGLEAVDEALRFIRSSSSHAEQARFHGPYRVNVATGGIDYLDVVTPFRRIVLAGSIRAAAGDRGFTQQQAIELLRESGERLDLYLELTFNPLNTYVTMPEYAVTMAAGGRKHSTRDTTVALRWTPRLESLPAVPLPTTPSLPPGSRLLGATLVAQFDLTVLEPRATYDVVVMLEKKEAARIKVDLGAMR